MSRVEPRLLGLACGLSFAVCCLGGCKAAPASLEVEARFAGGEWRKNWVVTVTGADTKGRPLEGPVALAADCGTLTGANGQDGFALVLGTARAQLSCDTEQQPCCLKGISIEASFERLVATGKAVATQDEERAAPRPKRKAAPAPLAVSPEPMKVDFDAPVRTMNPWGDQTFDPRKVYLFGMLSAPAGHAPTLDAICDLEDRKHPAVGMMRTYWLDAAISPGGELLVLTEYGGLEAFQPGSLIEQRPGRYSIDTRLPPARRHETPGCKPNRFWLNPGGLVTYRCSSGLYYSEGTPSKLQFDWSEELIALGYQGMVLASVGSPSKYVVIDSKLEKHLIDDRSAFYYRASTVRAVPDGFLFVSCPGGRDAEVCRLEHIDARGHVSHRGEIAALPEGCHHSHGRSVLDPDGNSYWVAYCSDHRKKLVYKRPLLPGRAEVLIEDQAAQPCDWSVESASFETVIGDDGTLITGQ